MSTPTPTTKAYPVGKQLQLEAPSQITVGADTYDFLNWTVNGETNPSQMITYTVNSADKDVTLTVTYVKMGVAGFPWWVLVIAVPVAYYVVRKR